MIPSLRRLALVLVAALAALAAQAAADAFPDDAAFLDGYGPLDEALALPYAFHHMGSLSARAPFRHQTRPEWRRTAARGHPQPAPHSIYPPAGCRVTQVVSLQRHGARFLPAAAYAAAAPAPQALRKFHRALANVSDAQLADPRFGILRNLTTPPGNGDLVPYGALQAYYSGLYDRHVYAHLVSDPQSAGSKPFIRASGNYGNQSLVPSDRVLWTARWWALGFSGAPFPDHDVTSAELVRDESLPKLDVVLSEQKGSNNTLSPETCPHLDDPSDDIAATYRNNTVLPSTGASILRRIHPATMTLEAADIQAIMQLCSYNSFLPANVTAGARHLQFQVSPVCHLFEPSDWKRYNYADSLDFYYYQGAGNPASKGAYQGYIRELYARLNHSASLPLEPVLTLNTTLVQEGGFPLPDKNKTGPTFFLDATHDANIAAIQLLFGLYDGPPLSDDPDAQKNSTTPFDTARSVPYQTKTAFESITCDDPPPEDGHSHGAKSKGSTEYVRVRVNEVPYPSTKNRKNQKWCPLTPEEYKSTPSHLLHAGLCPLPVVLRGLEWANGPGAWDTCFLNKSSSSKA